MAPSSATTPAPGVGPRARADSMTPSSASDSRTATIARRPRRGPASGAARWLGPARGCLGGENGVEGALGGGRAPLVRSPAVPVGTPIPKGVGNYGGPVDAWADAILTGG